MVISVLGMSSSLAHEVKQHERNGPSSHNTLGSLSLKLHQRMGTIVFWPKWDRLVSFEIWILRIRLRSCQLL
jgi:hypothetical protein